MCPLKSPNRSFNILYSCSKLCFTIYSSWCFSVAYVHLTLLRECLYLHPRMSPLYSIKFLHHLTPLAPVFRSLILPFSLFSRPSHARILSSLLRASFTALILTSWQTVCLCCSWGHMRNCANHWLSAGLMKSCFIIGWSTWADLRCHWLNLFISQLISLCFVKE